MTFLTQVCSNNGRGIKPPVQVAPFHQEVAPHQQHQPAELRVYHLFRGLAASLGLSAWERPNKSINAASPVAGVVRLWAAVYLKR